MMYTSGTKRGRILRLVRLAAAAVRTQTAGTAAVLVVRRSEPQPSARPVTSDHLHLACAGIRCSWQLCPSSRSRRQLDAAAGGGAQPAGSMDRHVGRAAAARRTRRGADGAALPASSAREGSKLLVAGARDEPCLRSRRCSRILHSPLLLRIRRPSAVCGTEKAPRGRICVCVGQPYVRAWFSMGRVAPGAVSRRTL